MRAKGKPVKVRLITESFAELALHWAKPSIAGMGLVLLLAAERTIGPRLSGVEEETYLGILQLS
jgi:hypothetical protein